MNEPKQECGRLILIPTVTGDGEFLKAHLARPGASLLHLGSLRMLPDGKNDRRRELFVVLMQDCAEELLSAGKVANEFDWGAARPYSEPQVVAFP